MSSEDIRGFLYNINDIKQYVYKIVKCRSTNSNDPKCIQRRGFPPLFKPIWIQMLSQYWKYKYNFFAFWGHQ